MKPTFDQIADAIMYHPDIESGLVQQTRARDFIATTKDKAGIPEKRLAHRTTFRVFVCLPKLVEADNPLKGKINYEASGADLLTVGREVFAKLKLPMPKELL